METGQGEPTTDNLPEKPAAQNGPDAASAKTIATSSSVEPEPQLPLFLKDPLLWVYRRFGLTAVMTLAVLLFIVSKNWEPLQHWGEGVITSVIHWRLPKADKDQFAVAITHLDGDDDRRVETFIVEALKSFQDIGLVEILEFNRTTPLQVARKESGQGEQPGTVRALRYLRKSGAKILISGSVWTSGDETSTRLILTMASGSSSAELPLPEVFQNNLWEFVRLAVLTQVALMSRGDGSAGKDELSPFVERVHSLGPEGWSSDTRAEATFILGHVLCSLAEQLSQKNPAKAVRVYREALAAYAETLKEWSFDRTPFEWAATQNNVGVAYEQIGESAQLAGASGMVSQGSQILTGEATPDWTRNDYGVALRILGQHELQIAPLEKAATAYREALKVWTPAHNPLDWAMTQNNLGRALTSLGSYEASRDQLQAAVKLLVETLKQLNQNRYPLEWATAEKNLGLAHDDLGELEEGSKAIEEYKRAIEADNDALKEWTPERVPLDWAQTQNNLGVALDDLGELEQGAEAIEHFKQGIAAYKKALKEWSQHRVPLDWAQTQNNLGAALQDLGTREQGDEAIKDFNLAIAAYNNALKERRQRWVPLSWAQTQNNLGIALDELGKREQGAQAIEHFKQAIAADDNALKERTRERVAQDWAAVQADLGVALDDLGEREEGTEAIEHFKQAIAADNNALKEETQERAPANWETIENNLRIATADLKQRTAKP